MIDNSNILSLSVTQIISDDKERSATVKKNVVFDYQNPLALRRRDSSSFSAMEDMSPLVCKPRQPVVLDENSPPKKP